MTRLGAHIEELRKSRGLSKSELARLLKMAFTTVNAWERRGAVPQRQALNALITTLRLSQAEQRKLLELAVSEGEAAEPVRDEKAGVQLEAAARRHLEELLTRALVPARHTFADAGAVFGALSEAAPLVLELNATEEAARRWLDAASFLRARSIPVTAARLSAVMAERSDPTPREHAPPPSDELPHPDESGELRKSALQRR